jgi:hypothetical protein
VHNENGNPFIEKNFHYGLQGGTIQCPTTIGEDCPICRFASQLWQKGEKDLAKKYFKSDRIYVPIIERASADKTPKFWGVSRTNYQDILNTIADPDYGDVVHPLEGRDVTVLRLPAGPNQKYGKITIKFKPQTSPIAATEKEIEDILALCPDFESLYPMKTLEELNVILDKTINAPIPTTGKTVDPQKTAGAKGYMAEVENALAQ